MFTINDYVILKKDINNIQHIYIITKIISNDIYIKGLYIRNYLIVQEDEIIKAPPVTVEKYQKDNQDLLKSFTKQTMIRQKKKVLFGRILHIDGDEEYLNCCLELYKDLNIPYEGLFIKESELTKVIETYLLQVTPDIIVITGHDSYNNQGLKDLNNYENSHYFIDTIRIIRQHFNSDNVVIISGACSSHFEALIASGANFASSPGRINIHTYDPAVLAIKVASTSCNKMVDFESALKHIENKKEAFGGIETKGKMKLLY